ncbi:hypothetical protein RP20_CCG015362 [Aedes albopictus]|nr:hypothetical protein RP20_CCG015362 [Aedes albopictus]
MRLSDQDIRAATNDPTWPRNENCHKIDDPLVGWSFGWSDGRMPLVHPSAGQPAGTTTYEDCEQPPEIAHGSARVTVDETEEFVTARFSCAAGYRLEGKAEIRCDIDSDEWQVKQLPRCVSGEYY